MQDSCREQGRRNVLGMGGGGAKYIFVYKKRQSPLESVIAILQKNTILYISLSVISNVHLVVILF